MSDNYRSILRELKKELACIGYSNVSEREFGADFNIAHGWVLHFDGEPIYAPGFTISISGRKFGHQVSYTLWILMRTFEAITGKKYGAPSIKNQIKFLIGEQDNIFLDNIRFDDEYNRINNYLIDP